MNDPCSTCGGTGYVEWTTHGVVSQGRCLVCNAAGRPSLSCSACCGTGCLDEGGQRRDGVRRTVACPLCCYVEAHRVTPAQRYALDAFRRNSGSGEGRR